MPRYRCDTHHTNPDGSISHYANWIGGPTLAKISNCLTEDGTRRTVTISGDPDSFFSIPAYTTRKGKKIKGFITTGDFAPYRNVTYFVSTDRPGISNEYREMVNTMVKDDFDQRFPNFRMNRLAFQGFHYGDEYYNYL